MIDRATLANPKKLLIEIAPLMFWGAVFFLILVAAMMVLTVDVPRVDASSAVGSEEALDIEPPTIVIHPWDDDVLLATVIASTLLGLIWPFFILESLAVLWCSKELPTRRHWRWQWIAIALCPPLRLAAPHPLMQGKRWLPWLGWVDNEFKTYRRVEKNFSVPMVVVASCILPVLIVEWTMYDRLLSSPWLRLLLHISTGAIWFAFALEFLVMMELSHRKLTHLKKHWIDLVIILLPLLSFLRSLQAVKATQLAKFTKLQQLSRMIRIYRLRGLSTRAFRAIIVLDVLQRVVGSDPQKRLLKLREQETLKLEELKEIQDEIAEVEKQLKKEEAEE
ncbi:MAG: hypothetical protein JNK90_12710 [Planctomycetaceae bacterium]|nr:hypothetical protein [Planctomycetaceae bacterium]